MSISRYPDFSRSPTITSGIMSWTNPVVASWDALIEFAVVGVDGTPMHVGLMMMVAVMSNASWQFWAFQIGAKLSLFMPCFPFKQGSTSTVSYLLVKVVCKPMVFLMLNEPFVRASCGWFNCGSAALVSKMACNPVTCAIQTMCYPLMLQHHCLCVCCSALFVSWLPLLYWIGHMWSHPASVQLVFGLGTCTFYCLPINLTGFPKKILRPIIALPTISLNCLSASMER